MKINPYASWLLSLYLLSSCTHAEQVLSISYVDHPAVATIYLSIIKAMYKEADISIELFQVNNSPRSIKALNDGFFDADIGKILSSIKHRKNIIHVPTPIGAVGLYLVCRKNITCNESILDDGENLIVSRFNRTMLTNILPIKAEISQIISQDRINKMLNLNRVDYSLIANDTRLGGKNFQDEFQVIEVSRENYYHILHIKNQHLISKLNTALKVVLSKQSKKLN